MGKVSTRYYKISFLMLIGGGRCGRVGVVCKNLHVAQPEVGINMSFSDKSDIIEYSVLC
jgi:hypothetical protein